jgi:NADH dehydrogenase
VTTHVVVIGAGFGGLAAVKGLGDAPVHVTLVDANNFHTFQPLLYQVATAGLDVDDVAYPVRGIFRRQRNVTFRMARVTSIDLDGHVVHVDRGLPLPYDYLVVAAGAVSNDYGVPGVAEHCFGLKSVDDAVQVRNAILDRLEQVAASPEPPQAGELDVVICGGGPTGVELAGAMRELFTKVISRDFPRGEVGQARVVLIEATDRLLGSFSGLSSDRALRTLRRRGVDVLLGTGVARVEHDGVHLADGRVVPSRTVVWAAGVRASPLAGSLDLSLGRGGRLLVNEDLSVPGRPEVFAIGDIASAPDLDGAPLPQVAQPAMQGGRHAARQIRRRLQGLPAERFRYHDKGSMATIGRNEAVTELPSGIRLWGWLGWISWLGLHLVELMGFRNRLNVFVNWTWNYLTYDRGARLLAEADRELR